jgi:hypothetical protein
MTTTSFLGRARQKATTRLAIAGMQASTSFQQHWAAPTLGRESRRVEQ